VSELRAKGLTVGPHNPVRVPRARVADRSGPPIDVGNDEFGATEGSVGPLVLDELGQPGQVDPCDCSLFYSSFPFYPLFNSNSYS
jgi:hypothetical protein